MTVSGPWVFEPKVIEVTAGTTVTWSNNGGQTHSVTLDDGSFDKDMTPGSSLTFTMAKAGTYTYHCKYHPPGMTGKIVVD